MEIPAVETELFHVDRRNIGRTVRYDEVIN